MVGENGIVPFAADECRNTSKITKIFTGPLLGPAELSKLVHGHGGQLAVGKLQENGIAEDCVVEIALKVQAVPLPLRTNDFAECPGRPTSPADGDHVIDLNPIAGLEFVEQGPMFAGDGIHASISKPL
jgi:hypothetical protein